MVNTSLAMFSPYWEGRLSTFCLFVSSSTLLHYEKESFVAATLSYEKKKKKKKKKNNVNTIAQNIGCGYTLEPPR